MFDFHDKIAVVTGAARGIGFCTAKKLAEGGAQVAIMDVTEEGVNAAAAQLCELGYKAKGYVCNIADRESVQAACEAVLGEFGRVDILVNNAGITRDGMAHKLPFEKWDQVISVNLTGAFNMCHFIYPVMRKNGYGSIVNVASTSAYGSVGQVNYSAAKAGLIGLTNTLAKEAGRYNVRVNTVCPGGTMTDIVKTVPEDILAGWCNEIPMNRLGKPEEQASAICFLCSDEASYISGECLIVDGGKQCR